MSTALVDFTGGIGEIVRVGGASGGAGIDSNGLWTKMLSFYNDGHLLGAGSVSGSDRWGIGGGDRRRSDWSCVCCV